MLADIADKRPVKGSGYGCNHTHSLSRHWINSMDTEMNRGTPSATPAYYTILVKGGLDPRWSEWFGGLTIMPASTEQDDTLLFGPIADQAALHGILNQISSLGLTLIAVNCLDSRAEPPGATELDSTSPDKSDITRPEESIRKP